MNQQKCPRCGKEFNVVHIYMNDEGELKTRCGNCGIELVPEKAVELSDEQSKRCDEIYQLIYQTCCVVTENDQLRYGDVWVQKLTDAFIRSIMTCQELSTKIVRFPYVETDQDGSQRIEEYLKY